jgi:hypothetical protein
MSHHNLPDDQLMPWTPPLAPLPKAGRRARVRHKDDQSNKSGVVSLKTSKDAVQLLADLTTGWGQRPQENDYGLE